ncbi:hypothetical protein Tco_0943238, partial [Tanacetum coccineum]
MQKARERSHKKDRGNPPPAESESKNKQANIGTKNSDIKAIKFLSLLSHKSTFFTGSERLLWASGMSTLFQCSGVPDRASSMSILFQCSGVPDRASGMSTLIQCSGVPDRAFVPKVDDVSLVDGVFDGAFGGDEEEDFVMREGVVVSSSLLDMSTKSCLGGMMVSLIFFGRVGGGGLGGIHGSRRKVEKMIVKIMKMVRMKTIYFRGSGLN